MMIYKSAQDLLNRALNHITQHSVVGTFVMLVVRLSAPADRPYYLGHIYRPKCCCGGRYLGRNHPVPPGGRHSWGGKGRMPHATSERAHSPNLCARQKTDLRRRHGRPRPTPMADVATLRPSLEERKRRWVASGTTTRQIDSFAPSMTRVTREGGDATGGDLLLLRHPRSPPRLGRGIRVCELRRRSCGRPHLGAAHRSRREKAR
jgi:hypothetical protein